MSAASRRKGHRAEVAVVTALRALGIVADTTRNTRGGRQGGADLVTDLPGLSIEVKDQSRDALPGWVDQARRQAADGQVGVVVHHRRGQADARRWFATMELADLVRLLTEGRR